MQTSVYDNIYTYLGHIRALYSNSGGEEMCALVYTCEQLTEVLKGLATDYLRDVKRFFLECINRMYDISFGEADDDLREEGTEYLDELTSILDKLA